MHISKIRRIKISRKKAEKASKKLAKYHYRRIQAEKGNTLGALFGRPR